MKRYPLTLLLIFLSYGAYAAEIYTDIARGSTDVVQIWLNNGGSVNIVDKYGNTPLLVAADAGHADVVRLLLSRGADVNAQNKHGYTPLFAAVTGKHPVVITELLNAGADINLKNSYGTTIQDYIEARNYKNINEYVLSLMPAEARRGAVSQMYTPLWERRADRLMNEGKTGEAVEVLEMAAKPAGDKGDAYAQYKLGTFYRQSGHSDLGIAYLTMSAEQGYAPAQNALGSIYTFEGRLRPAYAGLGFDYTKRVAGQGNAEAMLETGKAYLYGTGTETDYTEAAKYFSMAYSRGLADGRFYLGLQQYYGMGIPEDIPAGLNEIYAAAAEGSREALQQIKRFDTDAALEHISGFTKGVPLPVIKTYMLSQGAVEVPSESAAKCDSYDVTRFMQQSYGIHRINICEVNDNKNSMSFNVYGFIKPKYKELLAEYATKTDVEYIFDNGK